jgi:hypothetical protein
MSWLDALLGRIRSLGVDVALGNGLNFTDNLRAVRNESTGFVDVSVEGVQDVLASSTSVIVASDVQRAALTGVVEASQNANVTAFSSTAAAALRGAGLTVASGVLAVRRRPRYAQEQDYFVGGNAASGSIGKMGWNLLGSGTPAYARGAPNVLGSSNRGVLTTSAGANDRTVLSLGESETRDILPASELTLLQCAWNHDNVLTNKRIFFGLMGTFATEPSAAVDCLGIYYDSAVSANYQIIARSSSTGSPTVTATAVPANTAELITIHQASAGVFNFYSGATLLGTISSGVPTAAMNVGWRLETLTTAAKNTNIGYFGFEAIAANAFDDDTFLEV